MSMNVNEPEVRALAAKLARLRGVSLTRAVHDAVRHQSGRERSRRGRSGLEAAVVVDSRVDAVAIGEFDMSFRRAAVVQRGRLFRGGRPPGAARLADRVHELQISSIR